MSLSIFTYSRVTIDISVPRDRRVLTYIYISYNMVLPAQFQLGLELTNIVNPVSQAVSAVGSLALIDAIHKSGSDAITEMRLASFIGRHLIDPTIKLHFQEAVGKSDKSVISRYLDIVLESGSGPTVQEAIKNPALFSMVIQLSALAFAHEDESLAAAIVEAMENIVQESGVGDAIVPNYVDLLATVRACQRQTAGFRWASVYEAVEHKIQQTFTNECSSREKSGKRRKLDPSSMTDAPAVGARCIPFPVLQALLMWLHSLQKLPEHRLLHLGCDRGVSTIVVWCYHVLGLSVKVNLGGTSICFGIEPSNILIEDASPKDVGASLMDPADQHEPLFTLINANHNLEIGYESRAEAYGFGQRVLKVARLTEEEERYCSQWIIARCIAQSENAKSSYKYPCEDSMIRAGKFLFGLETVDVEVLRKHTGSSFRRSKSLSGIAWPSLAAILIAFARVKEQDLERCNSMPLSLSAYRSLRSSHQEFSGPSYETFLDPLSNLSSSFENLAHLLLGHMFSTEYVAKAILVCAWGWSIFLDIIDAADPSDASNNIRVMAGVPSRGGVRRARVIDGPIDMGLLPAPSKVVKTDPQITFSSGVCTGERGPTIVGNRSDAFQITQIFKWTPEHEMEPVIHKFGFRAMQEVCNRTVRLSSCECAPVSSAIAKQVDAYTKKERLKNKSYFYSMPLEPAGDRSSSSGRLIAYGRLEDVHRTKSRIYFFYVSHNAAARWLVLDGMHAASQKDGFRVVIRGYDTCIDCAMACRGLDLEPPLAILL